MTSPHKPRVLILAGKFPALSHTFLQVTFENMQASGMDITIWANKADPVPHKTSLHISYWQLRLSRNYPTPIKLFIFLFWCGLYGVRAPSRFRHTFDDLLKLRRTERWSLKTLLSATYHLLPIEYFNADVVYFTTGSMALQYLNYVKLRGNSVFSLRGSDINIQPLVAESYQKRLNTAIDHARAIHCVCEAIKQKAEGMVGHSLPNARVIYTAVNALFLEQPPKTDYSIGETIHLVSVGRIDWRKGLEHGLMAVRALVQRGYKVHWHIIGDGEYRDPVEWAILDMEMSNYITLEGPKDQQAIHQFLRDADIYFHPAVHEGLSNAIVEAMATAVPVVACDVCGNGEAVLVGQTGLLAPARDWKMMADQLEQLIKDEALRQRLGQAARVRAQAVFTSQNQMQGFTQILSISPME